MNRSEIKSIAKGKLKGNMWNIWWPLLIILFLNGIVSGIFSPTPDVDIDGIESINAAINISVTPTNYLSSGVIAILFGIIYGGYCKYILDFVRTGKFDTQTVIETIKAKWLDLLISGILTYIIVFFCTLLFVIPGIIMALAYAMTSFLIIDKDTKGSDSLPASRKMMKGYKWDLFVFCLSFLGWIILTPFTLFILLVWLVPYMIIAFTIYYDKLQEKARKDE